MVLIGLLYKCFCENFTTREFPNQIIHVFKQDLLKIKKLTVEYPIRGVNLNGSSNYLSKLEHLGKIKLLELLKTITYIK